MVLPLSVWYSLISEKVGLLTISITLSSLHIALMKVVFPEPKSPKKANIL